MCHIIVLVGWRDGDGKSGSDEVPAVFEMKLVHSAFLPERSILRKYSGYGLYFIRYFEKKKNKTQNRSEHGEYVEKDFQFCASSRYSMSNNNYERHNIHHNVQRFKWKYCRIYA